MAMRWDPLLVAATARALDAACRGARVRAVLLDAEIRRVALFLDRHSVSLELRPAEGWLVLAPAAPPPPEARRLAAVVERVWSPPDESILSFGLRPLSADEVGRRLVIELLGNRWNAFLVQGEGERGDDIVRAVMLPGPRQGRSFRIGDVYTPPRPTGRLGAHGLLDEGQWIEVMGGAARGVVEAAEGGAVSPPDARRAAPDARRAALLSRIAWTSSLNAEFLLGPDGFARWREMTDTRSWSAYLLDGPDGAQPYPVSLDKGNTRRCADILEAFRIAREESGGGPAQAVSLSPALERAVERRVAKAARKVGALRRELDTAEDPEAIRGLGNLILARFTEIPRGASRARLVDFDNAPIEVELDPTLSADRNASRYFEQAARIERARLALPEKIREAEGVRERWERLLADAREGKVSPEGVAAELGAEAPRKRSKFSEETALPYRSFRSSGGLEIRVGRGAKHNDDLTFRHSAPTDIWLHVRQNPGAHVILRWTLDERPPKKDLAEAATLAALHSPARGSRSVPVAWTRRKYVRKPRGAPPGTVSPDRTETVFVSPDPALLKLLRVEDPGPESGPASA
jgi:hypothetical protein